MDEPRFVFDTRKAIARVDNMTAQIARMPDDMEDTFMAWQVEDVNRNKPHVIRLGPKSMATYFWSRRWRPRTA
jgi:hypothetical protein